ncbi:glycosyltransferase family 4 protein [Phenylobacterium sp.]|jgi:glycosyltransferase involved in cell wall biosynthesis|uniref:glycosyltransferase family 4 protein n=1 Tax=Phenylobacterium sp. TaxID=1871053 RepID=UPI002F95C1ED
MRIAFSITDMSGGGAARVAAVLSNEWQAMGHEVHLVTFESPGTPPFFKVDDRVVRHQLAAVRSGGGPLGFVQVNVQRVFRVRQVFKTIRPDISISFLLEANVVSVLAARGLQIPTIVAERNHPGHHRLPPLKAALRKILYGWADAVCVQTREIGDWFARHAGLETTVIPNPAPPPARDRLTKTESAYSRRTVVGLGRLEPQKGFDRLIDAFAVVAADHQDWELVIYGEGAERKRLESQVERLGLDGRIVLPGVIDRPETQLQQADLFAHTAHYEGYPNAIIEAAAAGRCIVAMDSPGAAREILEEDDCGVLVPDGDIKGLASQMSLLMQAPEARAAYGARAQARVARLSPPTIAREWIDLARQIRASI